MPHKLSRFFLLVFASLALLSQPARAAEIDGAILKLTTDSYADTDAAVVELAQSGDPRAAAIVGAIRDGRLKFSAAAQRIYLADDAGLTDAATGQPVASPPADLSDVRVNNRVRRAVEAAMGALTLQNPDPAKRRAAAEAVFKSRDANALAGIEAALAAETDAGVKEALAEARAAILLLKADAPEAERGAAAETIRQMGDQSALQLLGQVPADAPDTVKDAAAAAVRSIESGLALWGAAQNVWYGLSLGSVLLLAAIGLAITFGVMGVINMAHGEMVMLGAYSTFVVQEIIRANAPGLFDFSLAIALPVAFLVAGAVGVAVERGIIRWLYGRPLETLLATWGLSLILQQAVRTIFGPNNREVGNPGFMSGAFKLGELTITYNRLWIVVFALVIFAALMLILKHTALGLQMRAVTQNRAMASSMGIRTPWIDALTFGLGSGIAGLAGVALSQIDNVSPNLGQGYIIDSFMVVVFGGVGNLWGTLIGALTLGIANKFLEPYAGAVVGKILVLVCIILFIQKRPRGLFALKGRAIEA